jgi:hypothetical protein
MTGRLTDFGVALLTAACAAEILADDPDASFMGPALVIHGFDVPDPMGEQSRRERLLDHIHAQVERTQRPKEPVNIVLYAPHGRRIA